MTKEHAIEMFEASGLDVQLIVSNYPRFIDDLSPAGIDESDFPALIEHFKKTAEIIEPDGYPSLIVSGGSFPRPEEAQWHDLYDDAEQRQHIERAIAATGQVRVGLSRRARGTAWLIGPNLVATARHVAKNFVEPDGQGGFRLKLDSGNAPRPVRIDFHDEARGDSARAINVTRPVWYEPGQDANSPDIALVEIEEGHGIPHLELERNLPPYPNQRIVVPGFPAPGKSLVPVDPALSLKYFAGIFSVKRVAPGYVIEECEHAAWEFCTNATLEDGSSGSPVVDVATGRVVGLHTAGEHLLQNRAVFSKILQSRIDQLIDDGVLDPI